jgi:hypothetical protein
MAFGVAAPGRDPSSGRLRTIDEFRDLIRQIVAQELIDIALMSASTSEVLAGEERLFDASAVTPAVRANDSTDIWLAAGTGDYTTQPSRPFRSASIDRILRPAGADQPITADLALYSFTANNDAELDRESLEAYATFRAEAEAKGLRHFLEVFAPNAPGARAPREVNQFVCDIVARSLAGLTRAERPLFLKIPYLGPEVTETLAAYDSSVILGILGGAAGTTHEAFALLADAKKHGVRAALFGRRINQAENQLTFIQHLRWIADGELAAEEAVRSYHGELQRQGIRPTRTLEDDLARTET